MKKHTILAVDDDPHILDVISHLMDEEDNYLVTAKSVDEALGVIEKLDINLLIVDYYLKGKHGTELITKIRENKPHVPVIMISVGEDVRLTSLEIGANVFLPKPFHGKELKIIVHNLLNLFDAYEQIESSSDIIEALTRAVDKRDTYTQGHHTRVAKYSLALYDRIYGDDDSEEREALRIGCILHDIGKIGIPDSILKSSTALSLEERKLIESHTTIGYDICKDLKSLKPSLPIIKSHHEKLDGTGYPDQLKKKEIPDIVAIAAIADVFDALTSDRSYHKGKTFLEAIELMEKDNENGEKYNAYFLSVFKDIII